MKKQSEPTTQQNVDKLEEMMIFSKSEAQHYLDGIQRCVDRLKRFIELDGPMPVVQNEVRMIQYRALSALSCYESYALIHYANADKMEVK